MSSRVTFGRYVLLERIAAGGMGEVWVGMQTGIGSFRRPLAVKLLLPHLVSNPELVGMFLDEARIGAQISHANVAQVYDVGFEADRYFIAMELVRGVSLSKLISALAAKGQKPSAELIAHVGRSLAEGLHVAHEQKGPDGKPLALVHRDVTPHNVLVSVDGAVKLTDFGIARVADAQRKSRPGVVLGKLGYLAPEQLNGATIDRRVDIFAAGATLYHFAALAKPFESTGALTAERTPSVPLAALRPDLDVTLTGAIERALENSRETRFQSARDLRNALPVPGPDIADVLGQLVRDACGDDVLELDHATTRASMVSEQLTPAVSATPVSSRGDERPTEQLAAEVAPKPTRRLPVVPFVIIALVIAGAGWFFRNELPLPSRGEGRGEGAERPAEVKAAEVSPPPVAAPPLEVNQPAPPPKSDPGYLTVDAVPWGEVFLDGKRLGDTPLGSQQVASGNHQLVVKNPETGKTASLKLVIAPRQRRAVRLELK